MARPRIRLGTAGLLIVIVALVLALFLQGRREAALRDELARKNQELQRALYAEQVARLNALFVNEQADLAVAESQAHQVLEKRGEAAGETTGKSPRSEGPALP